MTEPRPDGPYPDSIRSDSASGLGGLWTQLAAIASGLGALPQLAADIRYLVGEPEQRPPAWRGIGQAFYRRAGGTFEDPEQSYGLQWMIVELLFNLGIVNISNRTVSIDQSLSTLNARFGIFSGNGQDSMADVIAALAGLQAQINAGNQTLGDIGAAPVGSSIKDLLRSIDVNALRSADCCEGVEEPPPPEEPPANTLPPPTDTCADTLQGPHQCTGLYLLSEGVGGDDLYGLLWGGLDAVSVFVAVNDLNEGAAFPGYEAATDQQLCLVYDLTDNPVPSQGGNVLSGSTPPSVTGGGGSSFTFQTGVSSFYRPVLNSDVCFYFRFSVPTGTTPPNYRNFWLYWGDAPS